MSWKEENAVKRIFNTFKRLKHNIFNEDIEALKTISESMEFSKIKQTNDNLLYAKLLAIQLKQNLRYYQDMKMAVKKTEEDLSYSLDYHLQFLEIELNNTELLNYFNSLGLKKWKTRKQRLENVEIADKNQKEIMEKLNKSWSYKSVENSFYNTANSFLKDIKNYK